MRKKTISPSTSLTETMQYKYLSTEKAVFGRVDFEDQLSLVTAVAAEAGDLRPVEVRVHCVEHRDGGVIVIYEDGVLVIGCQVCKIRCGQVEVAERGRDSGPKILTN